MKKIIMAVCIMVAITAMLKAQSPSQQVTAWQYYFNTDPGVGVAGNGAIVPVTPAPVVTQILNIVLPGSLSNGFNQLYIRAKDEDGNWSIAERRSFYISTQVVTQQLTAMEYYIDTDPGVGNGTALSVTPGNVITQTFAIALPSLAAGFHQLYIRSKDAFGRWSIAERRSFYVITASLSQDVVAMQYYFNTDPGVGVAGNGAIIPMTPTDTLILDSALTVPLGLGCEPQLYVRFKDSYGRWSIAERRMFENPHAIPWSNFTAVRTLRTFFFTSELANMQTLSWNFDDGSPLMPLAENPSHTYAAPDEYNVCLTVSNAACGSRTICKDISLPGVSELNPSRYAPTTDFIGDIRGGGFVAGTTFKFIGTGFPDIIPDTVMIGGLTTARVLADFTGKPAGIRHLVAIIPAQPNDTLFDALTILATYTLAAGHRPALTISGPPSIRVNSPPREFTVAVTNTTDQTMFGIPLFIQVPNINVEFTSKIIEDTVGPSNLTGIFIPHFDSTLNAVDKKVAWLAIPYLAPGETYNIKFKASSTVSIASSIKVNVLNPFYSSISYPGFYIDCDTIPAALQHYLQNLPPHPRYPNGYFLGCALDVIKKYVPENPTGGPPDNGTHDLGEPHIDDGIGNGFTTPEAFEDFWDIQDEITRNDDDSDDDFDDDDCPECGQDEAESPFSFVNAADPNYKCGPINTTPANYINGLSPLTYQVHFENIPAATAPAGTVVIADVIDTSKFDMNTFQFMTYGFNTHRVPLYLMQEEFASDVNMNPAKDVVVRTSGNINYNNGNLSWQFLTYDPDTMSEVQDPFMGFLNPNLAPPEGQGYIEFSVKPKSTLAHNDVISNSASIIFDYNAPILTNTWINTIDKVKPASSVPPLPPTTNDSVIRIVPNLSDANAGILDYDLYVSENNGPWLFKKYIKNDTVLYNGNHGSQYRFYTIARDRVFNIEDAPVSHDASTTLDTTRTLYFADADNDGFGNTLAPLLAYLIPAGYVTNDDDCDDASNTIYPGATEIVCNSIDENCNGMADDGVSSTAATSATTNATNDEICAGATVNLTVNGGALGTGAVWNWYIASCTGALAGSGTTINVSPTSTTTYFVKAVGLCNSTTCVPVTVTVKAVPPASSVLMPIINLPAYACNGTNVSNIGVAAVAGATQYIFDGPTGTLFNGSNPLTSASPIVNITFGNPNGSGYYIGVQASNACGVSTRKSQWVRGIVGVPASITPLSGLVTHCANTSATFTCPIVTGATQYLWTVTGDATVSGTGTTATVNFGSAWTGGTLCVAAQTTCYTSPTKCIALSTAASQITQINGTFIACPGQTLAYNVAPVNGAASYNWILPSGTSGTSATNSINVLFGGSFTGGDIKVQVTSICGVVSPLKSKTINSGVPPLPASITGPLSGLCGQTIVYTCPPQSGGVTFTWTVPPSATINSGQGTNAISVTFGIFATSTVCVTAGTSCGTSPARCITVKGSPNVPGAITAIPSSWCANTAGIEFNVDVSSLTGSYTLSWLYPGTSVAQYVLGGGNSISLILNWLSGSGQVNVTASNACGGQTRTSTQASSCREDLTPAAIKTSELYVYPNPVSDNLNIEFTSSESQQVSIRLFDIAGQVVSSQTMVPSNGLNKSQMDVSSLAKGIYILDMNINQKQFKEKVVID